MKTDFIDTVPSPSPASWSWTDLQIKRAFNVMEAIEEFPPRMRPLGVRSIYYRVISSATFLNAPHWRKYGNPQKDIIKNVVDEVGNLLKWMRLDAPYVEGLEDLSVPMEWINDHGREVTAKVGFESTADFIRRWCAGMFGNFLFCKVQNQGTHIEVWVEKLGLLHIVENVVKKFCRQALAVRGYPSVTSLADYAYRVRNMNNPIILYFGDMDVDGTKIAEGFTRDLINDHDVNVEVIRCGLNPNQIQELHADPIGIKGEPKQKKKFIKEWGPKAYELDAIPPLEFERLIYDSLGAYTDMEVLEQDDELEKTMQNNIELLKESVVKYANRQAKSMGLS